MRLIPAPGLAPPNAIFMSIVMQHSLKVRPLSACASLLALPAAERARGRSISNMLVLRLTLFFFLVDPTVGH